MKTLQQMADDLSAFNDEADLRRLRAMPEAEFVMLLALLECSEIYLSEISGFPRTGEAA